MIAQSLCGSKRCPRNQRRALLSDEHRSAAGALVAEIEGDLEGDVECRQLLRAKTAHEVRQALFGKPKSPFVPQG